MATWTQFADSAPRIAAIFVRRHAATGNLCMLGTNRPDGFPRISPMEPQFFEGQLWLHGMPDTSKFLDLRRDPRFSLHTATADPRVSDGDAKIWGTVRDVQDQALHHRYAEHLYQGSGFDLRGERFADFFRVDVAGASSVEVIGDHLDVTVWREGHPQRVIQKH